MTQIIKMQIVNKGLRNKLPPLYFETREAAEYIVNRFSVMEVRGKTVEWELETIEAMSKNEAYAQFISMEKELFEQDKI